MQDKILLLKLIAFLPFRALILIICRQIGVMHLIPSSAQTFSNAGNIMIKTEKSVYRRRIACEPAYNNKRHCLVIDYRLPAMPFTFMLLTSVKLIFFRVVAISDAV